MLFEAVFIIFSFYFALIAIFVWCFYVAAGSLLTVSSCWVAAPVVAAPASQACASLVSLRSFGSPHARSTAAPSLAPLRVYRRV